MHKFWLWCQQHWFWLVLLAITLLAGVIRLYRLGDVPSGLTWDEAAIGYNGFAISRTLRDEWLRFLPISFKSFSDYKAPLAIYINGFFTIIFGLNVTAVRLPFALAGIFSVTVIGLLTRELYLKFYLDAVRAKWWGVGASFILATLPWHIHLTRAGFEAGMALLLLMLGAWLWLLFLRIPKLPYIVASATFLSATLYTYHSPKLVLPFLFAVWAILFFKELKQHFGKVILASVLAVVLLLPLAYDTVWGPGAGRLSQTTSYLQELSISEKVVALGSQFISHLSPSFLVLGETTNFRQGDGCWGVLLPTQFLAIVLGAVLGLLTLKNWLHSKLLFIFALFWTIIGLLPASLGVDVPHSIRAFLAIPGFIWLTLLALETLYEWLKSKDGRPALLGTHGETNLLVKSFFGLLLLIHCLFFIKYVHHYYTIYAFQSSADFQDGYLEMFLYIRQFEDSTPERLAATQIVVSGRYQQPYIFALFALVVDPYEYHYGRFVKYLFYDKVTAADLVSRPGAVVVATKDDVMPFENADSYIYDAAGNMRFAIFIND